MNIPDNCKEIFLEGITDAFLYPVQGSTIPLPFCVAQITQINNCAFPTAALHISTEGTATGDCIADNITAKVTPNLAPNGTVYTLDVSANIENGSENVREAYKSMAGSDHYIVLKRVDGTLLLGYTLPNTFSMKAPQTLNATSEQRQIAVSAKAMSEFIPITLKV